MPDAQLFSADSLTTIGGVRIGRRELVQGSKTKKKPVKLDWFRLTHPVPPMAPQGTEAKDWPQIYDLLPESYRPHVTGEKNWKENVRELPITLNNVKASEVLFTFLGKWMGPQVRYACMCRVDSSYYPEGFELRKLFSLPEDDRAKILRECAPINHEPQSGGLLAKDVHCGYIARRKMIIRGDFHMLDVPCHPATCPYQEEPDNDGNMQKVCGLRGKMGFLMYWTQQRGKWVCSSGSYASVDTLKSNLQLMELELVQAWQYYKRLYQHMVQLPQEAREEFKKNNPILLQDIKPPSFKGVNAVLTVVMRPQSVKMKTYPVPMLDIGFPGAKESMRWMLEESQVLSITSSAEEDPERLAKVREKNTTVWVQLRDVFFPYGAPRYPKQETERALQVMDEFLEKNFALKRDTLDGQTKLDTLLSKLVSFHEFYVKQYKKKVFRLPTSPLEWATKFLKLDAPLLHWFLLDVHQQERLYTEISLIRVPQDTEEEIKEEKKSGPQPTLPITQS